MTRAVFCGAVGVLLIWATAARADDAKTKKNSDRHPATITKVDAQAKTITARVKNSEGKEEEKTFHIADDAKLLNSWGTSEKLDAFNKDDAVCLKLNQDGKVQEMKEQSTARIKDVDAKKGTVTLEMTDPSGKDVTKTFHLEADTEYVDSAGNLAVADVFRSGDYVLLVEEQGNINALQKSDQTYVSKKNDKNRSETKSGNKSSK